MEAFPNGKNGDGPDALEGAWSVLIVDSARADQHMVRRSQDVGHMMGKVELIRPRTMSSKARIC